MKRYLFSIILALLLSTSVSADDSSYIGNKIQEFFVLLKTDPSKAIDAYFSDSVYAIENQDSIKQLKAKLNIIVSQVGEFHSNEEIIKRHLVNKYTIITYLALYERQPLTFQFEFYKPNNKWKVQGLTFNGEVDKLLEESTEYGLLKIIRLESGDSN